MRSSRRDHVLKLRETSVAIFDPGLGESGYHFAGSLPETPDFFERYTEQFDPRSGMGGVEIGVPIQ
jgi:AraC family transcriptional regulator